MSGSVAAHLEAIMANNSAIVSGPEPVAVDPKSRRLIDLARRVAGTDCTVLVTGESGTGKEVLARFIHRQSTRARQPFVAVNCAAIPEAMLEGVLFGYERGAFTGAHAAHAGKFEQAQHGTLLLDEITEMPIGLQAKLLRVLQEREVDRIGGRVPVPLDVRVIATSNRRLAEEVRAGRFREDLYYRLAVFPLEIAPLRERREDILPIATQWMALHGAGRVLPALSAGAVDALLSHDWPGNARELGNALQRATILCAGTVVERAHIELDDVGFARRIDDTAASKTAAAVAPFLPIVVDRDDGRSALARRREMAERDVLLSALGERHRNRHEVALRLGISPRTLRYKLARLRAAGIEVPVA
jgi:two-component system response regulator FlrC